MGIEGPEDRNHDPFERENEKARKLWNEIHAHLSGSEHDPKDTQEIANEIREVGLEDVRRNLHEKLLAWDEIRMMAPAEFPEKAALGLVGAAAGRLLHPDVLGKRPQRIESAINYLSDAIGILKKELEAIDPDKEDVAPSYTDS